MIKQTPVLDSTIATLSFGEINHDHKSEAHRSKGLEIGYTSHALYNWREGRKDIWAQPQADFGDVIGNPEAKRRGIGYVKGVDVSITDILWKAEKKLYANLRKAAVHLLDHSHNIVLTESRLRKEGDAVTVTTDFQLRHRPMKHSGTITTELKHGRAFHSVEPANIRDSYDMQDLERFNEQALNAMQSQQKSR